MQKDGVTEDQERPAPIEVPGENLSAETLDALIESFILREGTDYGSVEFSLAAKVQQVRRQIEKRDVIVVFDPVDETVTLVNRRPGQRS